MKIDLTRLNKIATQATYQMAADKEAVGLSRSHLYESKCKTVFKHNLYRSHFLKTLKYVCAISYDHGSTALLELMSY